VIEEAVMPRRHGRQGGGQFLSREPVVPDTACGDGMLTDAGQQSVVTVGDQVTYRTFTRRLTITRPIDDRAEGCSAASASRLSRHEDPLVTA
jgi:hypothetical protein